MRRKNDWENFENLKQRGEWVEMLFMAAAAQHGYHVFKPWGDSLPYDVGVEHHGSFLRVQIKSSSARKGEGYLCRLRHGGHGERPYNPNDVDLFAAYILPVRAWYLIPTATVFRPTPKMNLRFYPNGLRNRGRHDRDHDYEPYREAWGLLARTSGDLSRTSKSR